MLTLFCDLHVDLPHQLVCLNRYASIGGVVLGSCAKWRRSCLSSIFSYCDKIPWTNQRRKKKFSLTAPSSSLSWHGIHSGRCLRDLLTSHPNHEENKNFIPIPCWQRNCLYFPRFLKVWVTLNSKVMNENIWWKKFQSTVVCSLIYCP